jgi:predicted Zn-dependent protease
MNEARGWRNWIGGALLLAAMGPLAACETNPATGASSFTAFMSPQEEIKVGREEHPKLLKEFGGAYDDPKVTAYVNEVGQRLARSSELAQLQFTFTVVNSDIVNAFALPGGYVYVTRGLLALVSTEAELAGVLGHEIGHVTARHTAQRYSASVAGGLAAGVLGLLIGADVGQNYAVGALLAGYSRDQELEADTLGVRYLTRTNYDPNGMSSFLAKLQADSALSAELAGQPGKADSFDAMQSHPRTADRVREAIQAARAQGASVTNPRVGRDEFLNAIDGMYWGGDPESGFIRDQAFIHPAMRFRFEVPPGFRLFNTETQVLARGPNSTGIKLTIDPRNSGTMPMRDYLQNVWARGVKLDNVEQIEVNGMEAATGAVRVNTNSGAMELRLVVFRAAPTRVFRLQFVAPVAEMARRAVEFRTATYSFKRLSEQEATAIKPLRIRVVSVGANDTQESLARRMAMHDAALRRFQVLNGLQPNDRLVPGTRVKIIAD